MSNGMKISPRKMVGKVNLQSKAAKLATMGQGDFVSIFDLTELMGKYYPVNNVTLKLIDLLKPISFDLLT